MKKGISLMSIIVIIIVMVILLGTITTIGSGYIPMLEINQFAVELLNIQNATDEYFLSYSSYPATTSIEFDLSSVQQKDKSQFQNETTTNNIINFKVLDLGLIGITDNKFGNNKETNDVYVVSEETGLVYYLKGMPYDENMYYTLNKDLYDQTGITPSNVQSSNRVIKYDVIFELSESEYTKTPVTVNVKIPKEAVVNSITTTNSKSVSSENVQGLYNVISINETSDDKNGNYSITVNYTYNEVTKEVVYDITNFDNVSPNFTKSQTIDGTIKTVQITATDDVSGIKQIKYEIGKINDVTYFENYGKSAVDNKFVISDLEAYTIYVEDNAGNVVLKTIEDVPLSWQSSVIEIIDGVPIPKGFVGSSATGENTKAGGLVIYEGNEEVTDENVEWARRNINQYVWVPVAKEEFLTKFVRQNFKNTSDTTLNIINTLGSTASQYWEVVLNKAVNMPLVTQDKTYMTQTTLTEVSELYESVKKYEGFYIARYEAGIDLPRRTQADATNLVKGENVHSKMNKIPYNHIPYANTNSISSDAGGAVEVARSVYPRNDANYGVVSTLTYGVQWDTTLQWWLDTKAVESVTNSTSYGNYPDHEVKSSSELNEGALVWEYIDNYNAGYLDKNDSTIVYPKSSSTWWMLSTGALKAAKVNNIYDMAGNVNELTMEGYTTNKRVNRGGYLADNGSAVPVSNRYANEVNVSYNGDGFRVSLYIK